MKRKELDINDIFFKKIGPIDREYPILEIYEKGNEMPFSDIEINDDKEVKITFFKSDVNIGLTLNLYQKIYEEAKKFYDKEIE